MRPLSVFLSRACALGFLYGTVWQFHRTGFPGCGWLLGLAVGLTVFWFLYPVRDPC